MLKDQVIEALNELFAKFKVPLKIKDLFLYRPVFHELPFENFEPINEASRLSTCDPLCMDLDYEYDSYTFSYHLECSNRKGIFRVKTKWLKYSDIYPKDAKGAEVDEKSMTRKSRVDAVSLVLLRQLSLLARDTH